MEQLEEGKPIEHSDKWGKITIPFAVALNDCVDLLRNSEFWSRGHLRFDSVSFHDSEWTHYSVGDDWSLVISF